MAKAMLQGGGGIGKKPASNVKSGKPKKLSKAGEWLETHQGGLFEILDMRAVMK